MAKGPAKPEPPAEESADDEALLRDALKDVAPLPDPGKVVLRKRPPRPVPVQRLLDDEQVLADSLSDHIPLEVGLETGDELVFLRNGLSNLTLRKLRRGHWAMQDQLDLHGLRSDDARALLVDFLNDALVKGWRCVRIVHGKGLGILKARLGKWLPQRQEVLAYCQAPAHEGGGGALLVLLKARR